MIEITKLGQGANEKITDYYARSQELSKKIEAQIWNKNLGVRVIHGIDRILLKHFIFWMRQNIWQRVKYERPTTMEQAKEITKRQKESMEEEPKENIVPPSPSATTKP